MLDAAALAAILDPERKVPGWWDHPCPKCAGVKGYDRYPHPNWCPGESGRTFTGPADLRTAREHAWRLEDWLEARGYGWSREDYGYGVRTTVHKHNQDMTISVDVNHTAALVAAVERIANEVR